MRVYVVRHEYAGYDVYCPTEELAVKTVAICMREQTRRRVDDRESVTVSVETITKREWDELEDMDDEEC